MKPRIQSLVTILFILLAALTLQAKSVTKAMLFSAVLPGSGELYAGNITRGVAFATADLVILFNANRFAEDENRLLDSYKQFAYSKASVPKNRNDDYYKLIQNWYSSTEYNSAVEQYFRNLGLLETGNPNQYTDLISDYSVSDEEAWHWANESDWSNYKRIRKDKQISLMSKKLAIGAALANRAISVLDAVVLVRKYNKRNVPSFSLLPDFERNGAILNCSMEF